MTEREMDVRANLVEVHEAQMRAQGYRPPPRYRTIRAAPGSMWDGAVSDSEPLEVTIRTSLVGAELDYLKWVREQATAANDDDRLFQAVAPYVRSWNVQARTFDAETGELGWAPLPPPAEAGWEVMRQIDPMTAVFIVANLIAAPSRLSDDAAKTSTPSERRRGGASSETPHGKRAAPSPTPSRSSGPKRSRSSPTPAVST